MSDIENNIKVSGSFRPTEGLEISIEAPNGVTLRLTMPLEALNDAEVDTPDEEDFDAQVEYILQNAERLMSDGLDALIAQAQALGEGL